MKTSSGLFSIIWALGELKVQSHVCAENWSFCLLWNHIWIWHEGEKRCYMSPRQLVLLILKGTLASLMPSIKCIHLAAERKKKAAKHCKYWAIWWRNLHHWNIHALCLFPAVNIVFWCGNSAQINSFDERNHKPWGCWTCAVSTGAYFCRC